MLFSSRWFLGAPSYSVWFTVGTCWHWRKNKLQESRRAGEGLMRNGAFALNLERSGRNILFEDFSQRRNGKSAINTCDKWFDIRLTRNNKKLFLLKIIVNEKIITIKKFVEFSSTRLQKRVSIGRISVFALKHNDRCAPRMTKKRKKKLITSTRKLTGSPDRRLCKRLWSFSSLCDLWIRTLLSQYRCRVSPPICGARFPSNLRHCHSHRQKCQDPAKKHFR